VTSRPSKGRGSRSAGRAPFCVLGLLALLPLWLAIDGLAAEDTAGGCADDAVCESGFCDRGTCRDPDRPLGGPCRPGASGKMASCGPYVCIDLRCRS
jgi:hypothetical protein